VILVLLVGQKRVVLELLESALLDLLKRIMRLVLYPQVLITRLPIQIPSIRSILTVGVVSLVGPIRCLLIAIGLKRMLPEKILLKSLVLFAHSLQYKNTFICKSLSLKFTFISTRYKSPFTNQSKGFSLVREIIKEQK